ncbi:MAG: phage integrase SAM-like domain-containing protein [Comamonadaceae bacterium]
MAKLTGLFRRGTAYYMCVVLPQNHPLRIKYRNGKFVQSLGRCTYREAVTKGTTKRAEVLGSSLTQPSLIQASTATAIPQSSCGLHLRDIYDRWKDSKPRSLASLNNSSRAVGHCVKFTGNRPINQLTREQGDRFRAWLQHPDRKTSSKGARDRLTWVKSILKYASRDLGVISRNPWEGIDIAFKTTNKRRPWTDDELKTCFTQSLHATYNLPNDRKAGADAAYWIPLLGLYTGARVGELAQLRVVDIETIGDIHLLSITDEGEGQSSGQSEDQSFWRFTPSCPSAWQPSSSATACCRDRRHRHASTAYFSPA